MCGIAGEIRWDGKPANMNQVSAMIADMVSRGPDGGGVIQYDRIALGHRRLSIFDLSDHAQQPMMDPTLGLGMVFNGAIYNYKSLREELESKGYRFFSSSDTEVLLKAYHAWGVEMLPKLQGMFAFVIWERDSGKVILCRDRFGVKPLYYSLSNGGLQFASSLPALMQQQDSRRINAEALHYYLTFHAIPEPLTLLDNIHKLEPATYLMLHPDGKREQKQYWDLRFVESETDQNVTEEEWREEMTAALTRAIKKRLIADVPVGILLSGGLDSSLLVALIAKTTNHVPQTFSIGFESMPEEQGDEFYYSDMMAQHFATPHHKLFVETPDMMEVLKGCVHAMSEPMVSHDNVAFYLLSKEVAKHVKVVQSGQGADEIFAGYHWFQTLAERTGAPIECARDIENTLADRSYDEYLDTVTTNYSTPNLTRRYLEKLCEQNGSDRALDNTLYYESRFAMANGPLARVDNMTMAWGLEARVPFLDHEVAELASRMPMRMKLQNGGKHILKQISRGLLPDEIIDRPKGYFPVPALKYLNDSMQGWLKNLLSLDAVKSRGIFNPKYIQTLMQSSKPELTPLGTSKLWQLGLLEFWLQTHRVN